METRKIQRYNKEKPKTIDLKPTDNKGSAHTLWACENNSREEEEYEKPEDRPCIREEEK